MRTNPRIRDLRWPFIPVLVFLLLLAPCVFAQEPGGGGGNQTPGVTASGDSGQATQESSASGELSVVGGEINPSGNVSVQPVEEIQPTYNFQFDIPKSFVAVDRKNDEGGAIALIWPSSKSDGEMISEEDPVTGAKSEAPAYEYWVFHSETGKDGTWEQSDGFPTNSQFTWEQPQVFGFFLSDKNKGKNEHCSVYENSYPAFGIYEFSIKSDDADPQKLTIEAKIYKEKIKDYASVTVFSDLKPFGSEKVQLEYVPPEDGQDLKPWDNVYSLTFNMGADKLKALSITKPYFILFTAKVTGQRLAIKRAVLNVQPTEVSEIKPEGVVKKTVINGSGSEQPVPDNRYNHYFRVFTVPAGYALPEGQELPPDDWELGSMAGPIVGKANLWNGSRTNSWLWGILICAAVTLFIIQARRGVSLFIRRIAGLDHVDEAIGRATEMGRPVLYVNGLGYMSDIATIASVNILGRVARKVADYESRLLVPNRDPIVMAVCQEVIQEAYIDAGRPDSFNKEDIFFLTDDQFAYTAAVDGIMVREKPATNFFMGMFYAESLLLAETGSSTGAIQIAGTDALAQLPFFITACDYTLIGEELYAASAYLSREPLLLGSLKGQDTAKLIFMIFTFIGTLLICLIFIQSKFHLNIEFIKQLFQAF